MDAASGRSLRGGSRPDSPVTPGHPAVSLAPGVLRSHHAILNACLGSTSSAGSDEQPGAGVHLKRIKRERGPVQFWGPAPAHPAGSAALRACRVGPWATVLVAVEVTTARTA